MKGQGKLNSYISLSFTHKLSRVSKSLTALFGMRHLTYGTNFLHLFAFLVSRPPQSAFLHSQTPTLLLNRWSAYLTGSSILVLKLTFSPDPFPRNLPLSLTDWLHGFYPARFWAHFNIVTYLLTYLQVRGNWRGFIATFEVRVCLGRSTSVFLWWRRWFNAAH